MAYILADEYFSATTAIFIYVSEIKKTISLSLLAVFKLLRLPVS